jgi:hypothetical protein
VVSGAQRFPDWARLDAAVPGVAATMRRYLDQLTCLLRLRSVGNADQALRSLAAFLAEHAPEVTTVADINRHHIEDFVRWLAARSGRATARISPATLAHRLGTPRMFFVRIIEWDWPDAPAGCRSSPATCPARPPAAQSPRRPRRGSATARRPSPAADAGPRGGGVAAFNWTGE